MECCGVHSYKDFNKALEFKKYTNEEGDGQIIPEACCLLKDNNNRNAEQLAKLLFEPKDPNCVSVPTVTNSYMNKVILLYPTTVVDKIICMKNGFDIKMMMKCNLNTFLFKFWGLFWIYQLISTANTAQFQS